QVTGVIPGVTLTLTRPTTSPAVVSLAADSAALKTKVSAFVSAYNDVVNLGHNAAGHGAAKAANSVLAGDHAIRASLDRFAHILSSPVAGTTGRYTTLASVGISSTQDG